MKIHNLVILSGLWLCLSSSLTAGGTATGGGGPPAKEDGTSVQVVEGGQISEIAITPDEMKAAIEAALLQREIEFELKNNEVLKIKPETLDFKKRLLEGQILERNSRVILKEIQAQP